MVCKYLTWDVGKGNEALFWEDSWDGHPPLHHSSFPKDLKEKLCNLWGSRVYDYKTEVSLEGKSRWMWKPLIGLGLDSDAINAYEKILVDRRFKKIERKD